MQKMAIEKGIIHDLPDDIQAVLLDKPDVLMARNSLTPLARNEWICRVTIVKKEDTRKEHIQRLWEDLLKWKRRPCCRPGCPHHNTESKKRFWKWV
jgi:uncharacterized protein YdeI (YjbR/CyaY-like superfamily)